MDAAYQNAESPFWSVLSLTPFVDSPEDVMSRVRFRAEAIQHQVDLNNYRISTHEYELRYNASVHRDQSRVLSESLYTFDVVTTVFGAPGVLRKMFSPYELITDAAQYESQLLAREAAEGSIRIAGESYGFVSSESVDAAARNFRFDYRLNKASALQESFMPGYVEFSGALEREMFLVQYHDANLKVGGKGGRSLAWWTTADQANAMATLDDVHNDLALVVPDWGPRSAVSVARIPAGTDVEYVFGQASKQVSRTSGQVFAGEGVQFRFSQFAPSWIVQTRTIPGVAP